MLETIINEWFESFAASRVELLANSTGLSDAHVWKVTSDGATYCLKRWSKDSICVDTLQWQHRLLDHLVANGFLFSPQPQPNRQGSTIVDADGYLWDLNTWMPGVAYGRKGFRREPLRQAMKLLAQFHDAAADFVAPQVAFAPGLQRRREILDSLSEGGLEEFVSALANNRVVAFQEELLLLVKVLSRAIPIASEVLTNTENFRLPLQACLRDVKYDHVLFEDDSPSGLIDFGAAAVDSVACDIARLVGSVNDVSPSRWRDAIDAYRSVRALSTPESDAIRLYDIGGVVSAAANWLRWLVVEQRHFDSREGVQSQLSWLIHRLQGWS